MICSDIDLLKYEDQHQQEKTLKREHELMFDEVSSLLMLYQCTAIFLAIIKTIFIFCDVVFLDYECVVIYQINVEGNLN